MISVGFDKEAKRILKSELVRRGITNQELATRLTDLGYEETVSSVASKISRGTFSATFFLACLHVIECKQITLSQFQSIDFGNREIANE